MRDVAENINNWNFNYKFRQFGICVCRHLITYLCNINYYRNLPGTEELRGYETVIVEYWMLRYMKIGHIYFEKLKICLKM